MNEEISIESQPVDVQGWNSQDMKAGDHFTKIVGYP